MTLEEIDKQLVNLTEQKLKLLKKKSKPILKPGDSDYVYYQQLKSQAEGLTHLTIDFISEDKVIDGHLYFFWESDKEVSLYEDHIQLNHKLSYLIDNDEFECATHQLLKSKPIKDILKTHDQAIKEVCKCYSNLEKTYDIPDISEVCVAVENKRDIGSYHKVVL